MASKNLGTKKPYGMLYDSYVPRFLVNGAERQCG